MMKARYMGWVLVVACAGSEETSSSSTTSTTTTSEGESSTTSGVETTTSSGETTSTTSPETQEFCGDGLVDVNEVCDDGPNNGAYGFCRKDCKTVAHCGDGFRDPEEVCDAGPLTVNQPSNAKAGDCVGCQAHAECGDGIVHGDEDCDPGVGADTKSCDRDCTFPVCGDGLVNSPWGEVCDPGEAVVPRCSEDCQTPMRYVFVTKRALFGDLFVNATNFQTHGVDLADDICNLSAEEGGFQSKGAQHFKAWISDGSSSPAKRFSVPHWGGLYVVKNTLEPPYQTVAWGWAGLSSGSLIRPIDRDEDGSAVLSPHVAWTNVGWDGVVVDPNGSCAMWTTASKQTYGAIGSLTAIDLDWTYHSIQGCNLAARLYCVEDPS